MFSKKGALLSHAVVMIRYFFPSLFHQKLLLSFLRSVLNRHAKIFIHLELPWAVTWRKTKNCLSYYGWLNVSIDFLWKSIEHSSRSWDRFTRINFTLIPAFYLIIHHTLCGGENTKRKNLPKNWFPFFHLNF